MYSISMIGLNRQRSSNMFLRRLPEGATDGSVAYQVTVVASLGTRRRRIRMDQNTNMIAKGNLEWRSASIS
jgi:hypothetical protein